MNITDTDRLDFLERTQTSLYIVSHEEWRHGTDREGRMEKRNVFDGWCVGEATQEHQSPRAAIDSAMRLHEK